MNETGLVERPALIEKSIVEDHGVYFVEQEKIADETPKLSIRTRLHKGQLMAMRSKKRFVFVFAGTQGGKTVLGPLWLYLEMHRHGFTGDYLAISPNFPLQEKKLLPEYKRFFIDYLQAGYYLKSKHILILNKRGFDCRVHLGSADRPESLESATAYAAHLDECGQKTFTVDAWLAILRRLSIKRGRVLGTTTPYNLGWIKSQIYDRWVRGEPEYDVLQFPSILNPAFPIEEYLFAKRTLPDWKFQMFYNGLFTRPAGLIYGTLDQKECIIRDKDFEIPKHWKIIIGLDFGGVNTVALFVAIDPIRHRFIVFDEYHGEREDAAEDHVRKIKNKVGENPIFEVFGGAPSEDSWRKEFRRAGLDVRRPRIKEVEVGIDRVVARHRKNEIYIVYDKVPHYLEQKLTYSRELDEDGEPTEEIENKSAFHYLDAERYIFAGNLSDVRGARAAQINK